MNCYFIKSNYNGSIYKISDFYIGEEYNTNQNKMLDLNFKPADGSVSIMTRQIILPDETSLRDYTHMLVPEVNKIYEILKINQQNSEQYLIELSEDAFIGNFKLFEDKNMIVTRTTDYREEWYQGFTDITDMSYDYTYEVDAVLPDNNQSGSDLWAAVYIQRPDDELLNKIVSVEYNVSRAEGVIQAEQFDNIAAVRNKYPEYTFAYPSEYQLAIDTFFSLDYKYKVVYVKNTNAYYYYTIWRNGTIQDGDNAILEWNILDPDTSFPTMSPDFLKNTVSNIPDISTIIMMIPRYEGIITVASGSSPYKVPSMNSFNGLTYVLNDNTRVAATILNIRVIPESILNTKDGSFTIYNSIKGLNIDIPSFGKINWGYVLKNIKEEIDLSWDIRIRSIFDREPFESYELWVFGDKYEVPSYYIRDMHMVLAATSDGIQYNIYRDVDRRKLYISGNTRWDLKWEADQLELYAMNNPTYKDEFNNKMQQRWAQTLSSGVSGVASGAMIGSMFEPLGAGGGAIIGAFGAVSSAIGTGIQNHFDRKQFSLMQENKRMSPDHIFGNASGAAMINKIHNGIYWVKKTSNNRLQMQLQFYRSGYPTFVQSSIAKIDERRNDLINNGRGMAKVISGYFVDTIKNNYITNEVNKKIANGVILVGRIFE